ncbi:MAG: hypothetical protein R3B67_05910 [Phycisphaerales bacterium]
MRLMTSCVLTLLLIAGLGCSRQRVGDPSEMHSKGGRTLGLVVFGSDEAESPADRSARYIIEPGGVFRASFGAGSDALTYPPITRRLSASQLDAVWAMVDTLELQASPWYIVTAPELLVPNEDSHRSILIELGDADSSEAWGVDIENTNARELATMLGELAWVGG